MHLQKPHMLLQNLVGDIASWSEEDIWEFEGEVTSNMMSKEDICSPDGPKDGTLMLLPSANSWHGGRDLCRR